MNLISRERLESLQRQFIEGGGYNDVTDSEVRKLVEMALSQPPKLSVWYGSMPESNGKSNFTAILCNGGPIGGITIACSEYPERVRYEADRMRYLIGEISDRPFILDYDTDKHSGYKVPERK